MSLFDRLTGGVLGQIEAAAVPVLVSAALSKTSLGSLQGLVTQLQQAGLDKQVQSWLGSGPNMQVTADQLRGALQSDQVKQVAQHLGVDPDAALNWLAQHLPNVVDQASPNGTLQPTG